MTITPTLMPFGKYRGQFLHKVPTPYLFFMLCKENVRHSYEAFTTAALAELAERFANLDTLTAELASVSPPSAYQRMLTERKAKRLAELAKEKAQRLADTQARRAYNTRRRVEIQARNPGADLV